jgi:DNA-binding PadR family transcriptional regulator
MMSKNVIADRLRLMSLIASAGHLVAYQSTEDELKKMADIGLIEARSQLQRNYPVYVLTPKGQELMDQFHAMVTSHSKA